MPASMLGFLVFFTQNNITEVDVGDINLIIECVTCNFIIKCKMYPQLFLSYEKARRIFNHSQIVIVLAIAGEVLLLKIPV